MSCENAIRGGWSEVTCFAGCEHVCDIGCRGDGGGGGCHGEHVH